jgi:hypothetical protein
MGGREMSRIRFERCGFGVRVYSQKPVRKMPMTLWQRILDGTPTGFWRFRWSGLCDWALGVRGPMLDIGPIAFRWR